MSNSIISYNNIFYTTCTVYKWRYNLKSEKQKNIIYEAFRYLTSNEIVIIYAFVILDNHLHFIYEVIPPNKNVAVKHTFLSYTSKQLLRLIPETQLKIHHLNKPTRNFQFWKSPSLSVEIWSKKFFKQKFNYVHKNVERAGLSPLDYAHSSYPSYVDGKSRYTFLSLWTG